MHRRITIRGDKVYPSNGIRVYYIAYDTTEASDYIAANKQANIMLKRTGAIGQPIYAQVLGLFRLHAQKDSGNVQGLDVMWVQYYTVVDGNSVGGRCYPKLQLPTTQESYDFIDPQDISRGCHLIPDFASGRQAVNSENQVYKYYFVNM